MTENTQSSPKWIRIEDRNQPTFVGERVKNGVIERRAIVSYTTLDAAIWAAQGEEFNRIVNDQGVCAYTQGGKPKGVR